jgi:Cu/Ag efflux protein CusF
MRKHLILSLTLLLVLATAVAAKAADDSMTKKKFHTATGDVTAIDNTAQTFTISHGKESWTFKTDDSTKFKGMGTMTLALTNLKAGDNVRVSYTEDGTDKTAARVDVLHGKKSHA